MLRRQALGQLTNHTNQQQAVTKQVTKQVTNTFSFKATTTTTTTTSTAVNDENEIQQLLKLKQNKKQQQIHDKENEAAALASGGCDDGFEIFCDDSDLDKHHHVAAQPHLKRPLQPLNDFKVDSPMMLDISTDTIKYQTTKSDITDDLVLIDDDEDDEIDIVKQRKQEAVERENILMNCEEYCVDILRNLREAELRLKPKANYIKQQQDITPSMRSILVDWLVEVCEEYKLHTETLYLAVNYTDRFLSKMSVLRGKLQLLGTASIYIASKYEEIFPPDVNEFVYITDDTYTKQQVLRMEHLVLKVLNFQMTSPTTNCFLLHFLRVINANQRIEHLSRYLAELTLIEAEPFLEYLPSQIAASALYLALSQFGNVWTTQISEKCGYQLNDLRLCIRDLHKFWLKANEHQQQAIQEKYKQDKFDNVSCIQPTVDLDV